MTRRWPPKSLTFFTPGERLLGSLSVVQFIALFPLFVTWLFVSPRHGLGASWKPAAMSAATVALVSVMGGFAVSGGLYLVCRARSRRVLIARGYLSCPHCTYDLRGVRLPGACSECGAALADSGVIRAHWWREYPSADGGGEAMTAVIAEMPRAADGGANPRRIAKEVERVVAARRAGRIPKPLWVFTDAERTAGAVVFALFALTFAFWGVVIGSRMVSPGWFQTISAACGGYVMAVMLTPFVACIVVFSVGYTLNRRSWTEIQRRDFKLCPYCAGGLEGVAFPGACPNCGQEVHDPEFLRRHWEKIYDPVKHFQPGYRGGD